MTPFGTCFVSMMKAMSMAILICSMVTSTFSGTTNITTDQSALLVLKSHIIHDPQNILSKNWSNSSSICNWDGVICGAKHKRVTVLNLSYRGLTGTVPPELGNLSFLVELRLTNNSFHGSLPVELTRLRRLKVINFGFNNLMKGEIPSWFGLFPKLETLNLYGNQFTGSLPTSIFNLSSVQIITLSNNQLSGIPREIGNLTTLKELYLDYNNLKEIPKEIGNLNSLDVLSIKSNALTGPFPLFVFNISSLKKLNFNYNNLSGSLPNSMCESAPSLQLLALDYNQLGGSVPSQWSRCKNLQTLLLSVNHFVGSIPRNIGNLTILKHLDLGTNNLTGVVPNEIGDLQNLEVLVLQENHLGGPMPPKFFNISSMSIIGLAVNRLSGQFPSHTSFLFPNLSRLSLGMNDFTGPILNFISNASQLIQIDIPYNSFYGTLKSKLCSLQNIQWLNLASNNFTIDPSDNFFTSLSDCKYLTFLELGSNPLNAMLPNFGGNLSSSLQYFGVINCSMKGNIPKQIGSLSSLITLKLQYNNLTGSIPTTIGGLQKLQGLYLNRNKVEGFIPSEICQLGSLDKLFLANNNLIGSIPECLGYLSSLRTLSLNSNGLNSTIPNTLWSLEYILKLNLSSNSLVGSLPLDVENLKVVTAIDLSNNELSGNIPSSIGSLQNLVNLSLAQNRFTGQIPTSFGKLISIELMDLSRNNLSGEIPKSLEALLSLKHFNVSYNQLEGEIPTGGSFVNFSAHSFMSNNGLCGAPRLQVSPCKAKETHKSRNATDTIGVLRITLPVVSSIILISALACLFMRCQKNKALRISSEANLNLPPPWRKISHEELLEATNGFNEINLLGTGSFGSVYEGKLNDGLHVAIKVFNLNLERAFQSFDAECEVLFNLRHRNLVKILNTHNGNDFKALVLQFMPRGNLEKWLHNCDYNLSMLQRLNIMIDVASALEYLHHGYSQPVVHCDIKPSNILLDADMVAHVADFGMAKMLGENALMAQTKTLATIGYMAPEYGLDGIVSTKGDVYSYGILLMETFTGKRPTDKMFVEDLSLRKWVKESFSLEVTEVADKELFSEEKQYRSGIKDCLSSIMDLALNCSSETPENRKTIKDALILLHKIKKKFLKEIQYT
ncbi:LRR receptor-like serine/threonine-protein kinase EFR [Ziziphus jujuba]|uniref:LRR receptor-like serine/threonine-protein kinase EFR n=1 Tax=Ziziphus jujuba TaxID=326968 RepID=A0ABM3IKY4_ZIZJJ|nr:LRR receptor-like serine/threonine-protein kinase EFR [Ziziphus jujuba]